MIPSFMQEPPEYAKPYQRAIALVYLFIIFFILPAIAGG